jgi:MYXO-CTERM domain-containing protein
VGADADGSTVGYSGPTSDGGPAVDAIDAVEANVTRDASVGDASAPDLALASSSGCSCAVSATGPAARHDQGAAALLLFLAAACLRRRRRRGGH